MQAEELQLFEQRMRENAGLAAEVLLHRDVLAGMNYFFKKDLKAELQAEEARLKKKPVNYIKFISIAASVVLVMAATYLIVSDLRQADHPALYNEYFKPYPNTVPPAQYADDSAAVNTGMSYYESGGYEEAAEIFEQQIAAGSSQSYLKFYAGLSYLNIDKDKKAITYLEQVVASPDSEFASQAEWYLGLAYLKQAQIQKAEGILKQIASSGNDYSSKATEILRKL